MLPPLNRPSAPRIGLPQSFLHHSAQHKLEEKCSLIRIFQQCFREVAHFVLGSTGMLRAMPKNLIENAVSGNQMRFGNAFCTKKLFQVMTEMGESFELVTEVCRGM